MPKGVKEDLFVRFVNIGWSERLVRVELGPCWEWSGSKAKRGGYGQISGRGSVLKAHRLSYEYHHGVSVPSDLMVRHQCDNPPCVNPAHLLTGTALDNQQDSVSRGRANHQVMTGEKCPASKLIWEIVQEIRNSTGSSTPFVKKYGISKSAVSDIRRGLTWKDQGSVKTENY